MARTSPPKAAPRARRQPPPPPPPAGTQLDQPEQEYVPEPERELTIEEQRERDSGTLRFFGILLAIGQLLALGWAVRSHAPRTEYAVVAGAIALLFGLPMFVSWRSLAHLAARSPDAAAAPETPEDDARD